MVFKENSKFEKVGHRWSFQYYRKYQSNNYSKKMLATKVTTYLSSAMVPAEF